MTGSRPSMRVARQTGLLLEQDTSRYPMRRFGPYASPNDRQLSAKLLATDSGPVCTGNSGPGHHSCQTGAAAAPESCSYWERRRVQVQRHGMGHMVWL